jgi:hypothetical protein
MTPLHAAVLFAALAFIAPAGAQAPRAAPLSHAQLERNSVELKAGMTLEQVQKLLGKPKRTGLKSAGGFAGESSQGTLQWTYASGSEQSLQVVFAAKAPGEWQVSSWEWSAY